MLEYEESKDEMATLRRQNLVLWKHIKKLRKRSKKSKAIRRDQSPEEEDDGQDDPELDKLLENEI